MKNVNVGFISKTVFEDKNTVPYQEIPPRRPFCRSAKIASAVDILQVLRNDAVKKIFYCEGITTEVFSAAFLKDCY